MGALKLPTSERIAALKAKPVEAPRRSVEELEAACLAALEAERGRLAALAVVDTKKLAGHCNGCGEPLMKTVHLCRVKPKEGIVT